MSQRDDSSALRDQDPPILVTVDIFATRGPEASPNGTTVLRCESTTPPIPVTVETFETQR